jgi:molecular chaperone HtpG
VVEDGAMSGHLARMLKQAGQSAPETKPILEVNPGHALVKKLETDAQFDDLAHVLFDQTVLAEGGQLEDPAAHVQRMTRLLTA